MSNALKERTAAYATASFPDMWNLAHAAIVHVNSRTFDGYGWRTGPHYWWLELSLTHKLHPLVHRLVHEYKLRPYDWQQMLLEWPHVSVENPEQIAYTRNEEAGEDFISNGDKRQTRTSVGKYLARHYPHIPDHLRRDLALLYSPEHMEIWDSKEKIICAIEFGPKSCMQGGGGTSTPFKAHQHNCAAAYWGGDTSSQVEWDRHPYAVYAPKYGWAIAVRLDKGQPDLVLGRALVNHADANDKHFVRSYKMDMAGGYSHADEALEAWLQSVGYRKRTSWTDGLRMRRIDHPTQDTFILPYIDGSNDHVRDEIDYLVIDDDGPFVGDKTDGTPSGGDDDSIGTCECCGSSVREHESYGLDRWENLICENCCDGAYVRGEGSSRGGGTREYWMPEDQAVRVDGTNYDTDNLPSFIMYIESTDAYVHEDDAVYCETDGNYYERGDSELVEIDGQWYREDDDDVVRCEDDVYRMHDDCWVSAKGKWYSNDESSVDVSEGKYHPDELQEMIDNA